MKILGMTARSIAGSSSVSSRFSFPSRHLHNRQREENSLSSGVKHIDPKWHSRTTSDSAFFSRNLRLTIEEDRNFSLSRGSRGKTENHCFVCSFI